MRFLIEQQSSWRKSVLRVKNAVIHQYTENLAQLSELSFTTHSHLLRREQDRLSKKMERVEMETELTFNQLLK